MTTTKTRKSTHKPGTKREQYQAKIQAIQDQLEEWQEEYTEEEIAVLTADIQGYSLRNCMLIAMQCPTATTVRGYKAWVELGHMVNKGEHGIAILAPAGSTSTETEDANGEKSSKVRRFFRLTHVFDIAQTHVMTDEEKTRKGTSGHVDADD